MNKIIEAIASNTITFTRLTDPNCTGYEIYTTDGEIEHLIATLDNPKVADPIEEYKMLEYSEEQEWYLPNDVVGTGSNSIKVLVNGMELTTMQYTFTPRMKMLFIDKKTFRKLTPYDNIKVVYEVDRIRHTHASPNKNTYKIKPLFKRGYTVGQHTLI